MGKFISAFEPNDKFGGGVVTKKLIRIFDFDRDHIAMRSNSEESLRRLLRGILNWLGTPSLHPLFCMYSAKPSHGLNILNFSQTFAVMFRFPRHEFSLVAHDILVQKRLFPQAWIRVSEGRIFSAARTIYVLSDKDARLLRRFYGIDSQRIINLLPALFPNLVSFVKVVPRSKKFRALFIGSLNRVENLRGLSWFYKAVYQHCCETVEVACVGETRDELKALFPGIVFLGHVVDLSALFRMYDLTIAPVTDGAGIKVKVVDSLSAGVPVLGTPKAFEGLGRPNLGFCSNDPNVWIAQLQATNIDFCYRAIGLSDRSRKSFPTQKVLDCRFAEQ